MKNTMKKFGVLLFRDLSRFLKEIDGRSDVRLARSEARTQATAEMKGGEHAIFFHPIKNPINDYCLIGLFIG